MRIDRSRSFRDERRQRWVNNKVTASTNKTRPCNDDNHSATAKPKTTKTNSAEGKLLVKDGDLLQADDDMIIHQTNCVSASAKGLAKDIFMRFPHADTYQTRGKLSKPVTINVHGRRGSARRMVTNPCVQHWSGLSRKEGKDDTHEWEDCFCRCM